MLFRKSATGKVEVLFDGLLKEYFRELELVTFKRKKSS